MIPKDTLFSNIKLIKKRSAFTLELFRTIKDFSFANDIFLFRKLQISSLFRKLQISSLFRNLQILISFRLANYSKPSLRISKKK